MGYKPSLTHQSKAHIHARTYFREKGGILFNGRCEFAKSRKRGNFSNISLPNCWKRCIIFSFICLLLSGFSFGPKHTATPEFPLPAVRVTANPWHNYFRFHKKVTFSYITENIVFPWKGAFHWTLKSAISVENGVFRPESTKREGVVFFKFEHQQGCTLWSGGEGGINSLRHCPRLSDVTGWSKLADSSIIGNTGSPMYSRACGMQIACRQCRARRLWKSLRLENWWSDGLA